MLEHFYKVLILENYKKSFSLSDINKLLSLKKFSSESEKVFFLGFF